VLQSDGESVCFRERGKKLKTLHVTVRQGKTTRSCIERSVAQHRIVAAGHRMICTDGTGGSNTFRMTSREIIN
jgi:hypothetical protein